MAKKDTYLALLRRGIDDTTAQQLADAGLKIGDLKKIDRNMLIENYGLKADIADGVISIINSGHSSHGKERFLASVLAPEKKVDSKIEEIKFQRKQKDVLTELAEQKERLKIAKVEAFRAKKLIMNRLSINRFMSDNVAEPVPVIIAMCLGMAGNSCLVLSSRPSFLSDSMSNFFCSSNRPSLFTGSILFTTS